MGISGEDLARVAMMPETKNSENETLKMAFLCEFFMWNSYAQALDTNLQIHEEIKEKPMPYQLIVKYNDRYIFL